MLTMEWNDGMRPEDDPELMYEYTEEYAEMRQPQDEHLDYGEPKSNGTQS